MNENIGTSLQWFGLLFLAGLAGAGIPLFLSLFSKLVSLPLKGRPGSTGEGQQKFKKLSDQAKERTYEKIGDRFQTRFFSAAILGTGFFSLALLLVPLAGMSTKNEALFLITLGGMAMGFSLIYIVKKGNLQWR